MTTPTANPAPEPDLTLKAELPITHAVVLYKISESVHVPIAAIEVRQDGHTQGKGAVEENTIHFIKAARVAVRQTFRTQVINVFSANPSQDADAQFTNPPAAESPSA